MQTLKNTAFAPPLSASARKRLKLWANVVLSYKEARGREDWSNHAIYTILAARYGLSVSGARRIVETNTQPEERLSRAQWDRLNDKKAKNQMDHVD